MSMPPRFCRLAYLCRSVVTTVPIGESFMVLAYCACAWAAVAFRNMSRKYKFRDQDQLYFVSFAVVGWLDLFIRPEYKDILLKSFQYCCEHKGLELYAYGIMTSHVQLIIGSR